MGCGASTGKAPPSAKYEAIDDAKLGRDTKSHKEAAAPLELATIIRDPLRVASFRRHAADAAAPASLSKQDTARRAAMANEAQIALLSLQLDEALTSGDKVQALIVSEQLRSTFLTDDDLKGKSLAPDASPSEMAAALVERASKARTAIQPALEAMRQEIAHASVADVDSFAKQPPDDGKGATRVVILGGGPCGLTVAHALIHRREGFHVTIVDTKDYYEDQPSILRMMTANDCDEFHHTWLMQFEEMLRGASNATFICGTAAAVRKDHVLVGTTHGVASKIVPYDYLVLSTGSSYASDEIKTNGTCIGHRTAHLAAERQRMAQVPSFSIVGAGLVGMQLACDLKHYFPEKEVNCYARGGGWLPRIPGAHEKVAEHCTQLGVAMHSGKEIVATDDEGRMVVKGTGEKIGPPGAKVYWCTGYKPNNDYILGPLTDPDIASCLDRSGFVVVDKCQRLDVKRGLGHIFAGGDLASANAHADGERTAMSAWLHAGAILENIVLAAGKREGNLKMAMLGLNAGTDLIVTIGPNTGLLYATDPNLEMYFQDKEGLRATYGEIKDAGKGGWQEVTHGTIRDMYSMNWLLYANYPGDIYKMYTADEMGFYEHNIAPAIHDLDTPEDPARPPLKR
jgi:NADH dehydrogenase FAD-containing subunit